MKSKNKTFNFIDSLINPNNPMNMNKEKNFYACKISNAELEKARQVFYFIFGMVYLFAGFLFSFQVFFKTIYLLEWSDLFIIIDFGVAYISLKKSGFLNKD